MRDISNKPNHCNFITDDVKGFDEIWIIGETNFTHNAVKHLRPLINSGRKTEAPPYFTSRYDIYWSIDYEAKNLWSQIQNSLVKLMNDRWKLPNYILLLFSNKCVNDTLHYAQYLHIPMNALGDFINRVIFERNAELPTRALRATDPQIVLIRTVSKSEKFQEMNNFKNKRRTFNKAVQRLAERSNFRAINIDEIMPKRDLFEENGGLAQTGFATFWSCINIDIRQNDVKRLNAFEQQAGPIPVRHNLGKKHGQNSPDDSSSGPRKHTKDARTKSLRYSRDEARRFRRNYESSDDERAHRFGRLNNPGQRSNSRAMSRHQSEVYWE